MLILLINTLSQFYHFLYCILLFIKMQPLQIPWFVSSNRWQFSYFAYYSTCSVNSSSTCTIPSFCKISYKMPYRSTLSLSMSGAYFLYSSSGETLTISSFLNSSIISFLNLNFGKGSRALSLYEV